MVGPINGNGRRRRRRSGDQDSGFIPESWFSSEMENFQGPTLQIFLDRMLHRETEEKIEKCLGDILKI